MFSSLLFALSLVSLNVDARHSAHSHSVLPVSHSSLSSSKSSSSSSSSASSGAVLDCEKFGPSSANSTCQSIVINSLEDFCVWGPPKSDGLPAGQSNSTIGQVEKDVIGFCTKSGHGTRLIPDGTITGAHWIQSENYVQVTGIGNFHNIGIVPGDFGGELDAHGPDGKGNPVGGRVTSTAFDSGNNTMAITDWIMFVNESEFCFRACKNGPNAKTYCEHMYDTMGCYWNMPGDYTDHSFDSCSADSGEPMGIYTVSGSVSHYSRLATPTPEAHAPPSTSECKKTSTIPSNGYGTEGANVMTALSGAPQATTGSVPTGATDPSGKNKTGAAPASLSSAFVHGSKSATLLLAIFGVLLFALV